MKVITEAILRDELRDTQIETYVIPEGKILSPAAREYLQQNKVKIVSSKDKPLRKSNIEVEPQMFHLHRNLKFRRKWKICRNQNM